MVAVMQKEWQNTKWGSLATLEYGKSLRSYDEEPSEERPFRVFGTNGPIGWHSSPLCRNPSIIVGRKGAYRGIHFSREPFFVIDTAFYLKPKTEFDIHWAYYQLKDYDINKIDSGSAIPSTNREAFYEIPVFLPPLPMQRRIAGILSAYDELIENSQRRIKILESMARALYREWFVLFRFPGHEKVLRVSSSLGEIPKGWEACELGNFVQFKSGFAFKSGMFTADGEHRLVTIKNVQDGSFYPESDSRMSELPQNLPPYCVLEDGDILLSLTGNVGRVCLVYDGPFLLNQRVSKLVPVESADWAMTYCMFRDPEMRVRLEQLSNGVAQQNLSPVLASKMAFACPPRELRQRFAKAAEPMVNGIVQLYSKIQNLRRTRDLLLPRLLSGQVEVRVN